MTEEDQAINNEEVKTYEIGYLMAPYVPTAEVKEAVEKAFKGPISRLGGVVTGELEPEIIPLAYTVTKSLGGRRTKFNDAYFGALKFTLKPEQALLLKEEIEKTETVLRCLILALSKNAEKLPLVKRFAARREDRTSFSLPTAPALEEKKLEEEGGESQETVKAEMTEEDMDKEIDNLLVEKTA